MRIIYDQDADYLSIELRLGFMRFPTSTHKVNEHIDEHGAPGCITISNATQNVTEPGKIEFRKNVTL